MRKSIVLCSLGALVVVCMICVRIVGRKHDAKSPTAELAMPIKAGEELFRHEWKSDDPLANGGDGLGPVYNAVSCVACHFQNGAGGSGSLKENVTTFTVRPPLEKASVAKAGNAVREGVLHNHSTRSRSETLADVHPDLPPLSRPSLGMLLSAGRRSVGLNFPAGVHVSQRNTPALFGARMIDDIADDDILAIEKAQKLRNGAVSSNGTNTDRTNAPSSAERPVGRASRLAGGSIGKFGWKGQSASLASFVRAACANELGLGNSGQAQPRPLFEPDTPSPALDLTDLQCDQLTAYVAALPRPKEKLPADAELANRAQLGRRLFETIGCAECHVPNVGAVAGLYSDLLLHQMGAELAGGGSYNEPPPLLANASREKEADPGEWRTPPLWGVADSAPYLHDGRAPTLEEAIVLHGGQAASSTQRFNQLSGDERGQLIAFLKTLRAPLRE